MVLIGITEKLEINERLKIEHKQSYARNVEGSEEESHIMRRMRLMGIILKVLVTQQSLFERLLFQSLHKISQS